MADPILSPIRALLYTAAGAAGLLLSATAASIAVWGKWGSSPGRRALIHWLPIAGAVVAAIAWGSTDVALGIAFGTSVALLSTAMGAVSTVAPVGPAPARWKRIWPFTLAAALIVFVSGFNGLLTWKHGVALAMEGLVLWPLWREGDTEHEWEHHHETESPSPLGDEVAWMIALVAVLSAGGAVWLALRGADGLGHYRVRISPGAIGASLLSLMLISPIIQAGRRLAMLGASWVPVTTQIGVVLLNLCVLVPAVALTPYIKAWWDAARGSKSIRATFDTFAPHPTIFPLATWRIDAVALVLLSVLFLPVAVGKWNLGKEEGFVMIVGYCFYLIAVMAAGV